MDFADFMQYPHFQVVEGVGVLPYIKLPKDWKQLLPKFHESGGRKEIEHYTSDLQDTLNQFNFGGSIIQEAKWDIRLNWEENGLLTNIGINGAAGLDLETRTGQYITHNLAVDNAIAAGIVAQEYVRELLKHRK
jgi:hypothetical protein